MKPSEPVAGANRKSFRHRLFRGGAWLVLGRVCAQFSLFFTQVLLAKLCLTPAEFGVFILVSAIVQIAAVFAVFGIPPIVMRTLRESISREDLDRASWVVGAGSRMLLMSAALVAGCVTSVLLIMRPENFGSHATVIAVIAGVWIFLLACNQLISEIFTGCELFQRSVLLGGENGGIVQNVFLLVAAIGLYLTNSATFLAVMTLQLVGPALAALVSLPKLRKLTGQLQNARTERAECVGQNSGWLARESSPVMLRSLLRVCMVQLDVFLVGAFLAAPQVAAYGAARALVRLISSPLRLANVAVAPFVPELNILGEKAKLETMLRASATLAGFPAILFLGVLIVAPGLVLHHLFGPDYVMAAFALRLLAAASVAFVAVGGCGMVLLMTGHQRASLINSLAAFVLQILFTPWLIYSFGITGAAVATSTLIVMRSAGSMLLVRYCAGVWSTMTFSPSRVMDFVERFRGRRRGHLAPSPGGASLTADRI